MKKLKKGILCLGIETSCDETSAAVVGDGRNVLSNIISSQISIHQRFGGVVPEIASRRHVEMILPVVDEALRTAGVGLNDIDCIAATYGPGLVGGLLVGLSAAKALAVAAGKPFIGVNHIEGHIFANFLEHRDLVPPLVCLTVSGGHTDLLYMKEDYSYELIGRTKDDAAGEAFDKVVRVLGLGYPGGPIIDKRAMRGNPNAIEFPRALTGSGDYDFSFSGLKTAVINYINSFRQREGRELEPGEIEDVAASFQQAVIDSLAGKLLAAAEDKGVKRIILSGGVAANSALRRRLAEECRQRGIDMYYPSIILCTDNAAMIACVGSYRYLRGETSDLSLNAVPGLRLS